MKYKNIEDIKWELGMVVEREGDRETFTCIFNDEKYPVTLHMYRDDSKIKLKDYLKKYDISKVTYGTELVWERKKDIMEMSEEEISEKYFKKYTDNIRVDMFGIGIRYYKDSKHFSIPVIKKYMPIKFHTVKSFIRDFED